MVMMVTAMARAEHSVSVPQCAEGVCVVEGRAPLSRCLSRPMNQNRHHTIY